MRKASDTLDRVCMTYISAKREYIRAQGIDDHDHSNNKEGEDLLTSHIKLDTTKYELLNPSDDKFLRDMIVAFMAAGRDTSASSLTWFFWLLSINPNVVTKIRQEINTNLPRTGSNQDMSSFLNKLVYLHAALNETIRLYPPIPIVLRSSLKQDVLPSGHEVKSNTKNLIHVYAMGRMKAVWGDDALEFKPERWVSETGGLRHEPSYKFSSFMAGPRICRGKHLAMVQMKTVVVEILQNYDIKVVEGQKIEPQQGPVLHMKHGLNITLAKRSSASNEDVQVLPKF
ncbi:unnamed protein product [Microthlaspi erraticum]|uniref:Cytochrome P450 n=1 Tax=Microthlaspi erraticum TaxID=1685480 RepID=A0A6D2J3Y4_9BRAS|nr:unnamed protein product [Microthlaspi erraticum]